MSVSVCVSDKIECSILYTHTHTYIVYVFVCMFVMNLTLKFACAINANILFLFLFLFFVFLCPLPAARVCKNVPHVLTKWGKVVDREGERFGAGGRSAWGAWLLCLSLCL